MARVVVMTGMPPDAAERSGSSADWCLQWHGRGRNLLVDLSSLEPIMQAAPSELTLDILDIAVAVYAADIAVPRGRNEAWTRELSLLIPVRRPDFWEEHISSLLAIVHGLSRDGFDFEFRARDVECPEPLGLMAGGPAADRGPEVNCVCTVSGGVDSLAGGTMLLRADRRALFLSHRSGNPYVRRSQAAVERALDGVRPGAALFAGLVVHPLQGPEPRFGFPTPADRENSRRLRAFLFMAMLTAAACGAGIEEAYLCDNGVLTIALPMSPGRVGSLSTRSTHPTVLAGFNTLARAAGIPSTVLNPFIYRTKGEIIREILRPVLTPAQIQATTSCWMSGRHSRPCGGCIPCLLRRISMLAAGLPDETYEIDILGAPRMYRNTEAHDNIVDLLTQAARLASNTDEQLLMQWPQLLDLTSVGVAVDDALAMYRRYCGEVRRVMHEHFPEAALLMGSIG